MSEQNIPSPIDLRDPTDARQWESAAQKRPGRIEIFGAFRQQLSGLEPDMRLLELGSGPGFLAAYLLDAFPRARLTLLDFSAAMHDLARARLGSRVGLVRFVERNFKEPGWSRDLGPFDAVITNQAVHELRHKRHAAELHAAVRTLLAPGGVYLVSDHFFGENGLSNDQLYMTAAEQRDALSRAGFPNVVRVASVGTLVMHRAT
jgi:cyclopropane fatty-acyl-phospholipid synthase-like methyltransferase